MLSKETRLDPFKSNIRNAINSIKNNPAQMRVKVLD